MKIEIVYGVTRDDIDEMSSIIEKVLGVKAQPRENDARGGDYYLFEGKSGEELYLMTNRDPYDEEPLFDEAAGRVLVSYLSSPDHSSDFVAAIDHEPDLFVKLSSKIW
ncbi:MAG: hypothetical protein WC807_13810 [Hyphomicrobium sp.]